MTTHKTQQKPNECWYHGRKIAWIDKTGKAHVQASMTDIKGLKVASSWLGMATVRLSNSAKIK